MMQANDSEDAKPFLGTIVVDSSTLDLMLVPRDGQPDFINTLIYLGREGYDVVFSEGTTLRFAKAGVFRDGSNSDSYRLEVQNTVVQEPPPLRKFAQDFFGKVGRHEYPGLYIAAPLDTDTSLAGKWVRELWKNHSSGKSDSDKNKAYGELKKWRPNIGYGSIPQLILRACEKDAPVFFLSDNTLLSSEYASMSPRRITRLNLRGLLTALQSHGLFEKIGFSPDLNTQDVMTDILKTREAVYREPYTKDSPHIRIDTSLPGLMGQDHAFSRSLDALGPYRAIDDGWASRGNHRKTGVQKS